MTPRQKLELRRSEVRKRLGEIAALEGDALTDEVREERGTLLTELQDSEDQMQAAIRAEEEETETARRDVFAGGAERAAETPEEREFRALEDGVELRNYTAAAVEGRALNGREAELEAALLGEQRSAGTLALLQDGGQSVLVPWSAFAGRTAELARGGASGTAMRAASTEARADAASSLPAAGVQVGERDFVGRVFAGGGAMFLGVRFDTVEVGEASYFVLTDGAAVVSKAPGAVKDAQAASLTGLVCEPHRLSAAYTMRLEDLARSMRYEPALRRDLLGAASQQIDDIVLNGEADGPDGFFNTLVAPDAPGAIPTRPGAVKLAADGVDGLYARNLREVRMLLGPHGYRVLASTFNDAQEASAADYLLERSGGFAASALVPDPSAADANPANIQDGLLARVGVMGNAVAAMWDMTSMTIVRDEYTRANRGEVRLQLNMLWDFKILRAAGFQRVRIKVAA